eukprot:2968188-Pyramimonas_sp.AAC.1
MPQDSTMRPQDGPILLKTPQEGPMRGVTRDGLPRGSLRVATNSGSLARWGAFAASSRIPIRPPFG